MTTLGAPKPGKQAKRAKNPPIDKAAYLEWREEMGLTLLCDCCCGKFGQDMHHVFIGRHKGYSVLDDFRNIAWVNHNEHISRKFDNLEFRKRFWIIQTWTLGREYMQEWIDAVLAAGLDKSRIDWL